MRSFISRFGLVTLLFFGCVLQAHAEDSLPSEWKTSTHGNLELDSTEYFESIPPTNSILETARASVELNARHNDWRFKLVPLAQVDPINNSNSERAWIDAQAAYTQYQSNGWTLQLGMNTFTWGVTDGYNPLDVVSARRYQEPLNPDKLGAPSVYFKKEIDSVTFEGIYIPWQRKSVLPGNNSRWLPRQVFSTTSVGDGTQSAILNLPPDLQYDYDSDIDRDRALFNNFGGRIQITSIIPGLDASIEGFQGAATTPALDLHVSGTVTSLEQPYVIDADPLIGLTPVYYRQNVYGGTLVYANFGMIFRGEVAFTRVITRGLDLPGDSEQYVIGAERSVPIGKQDLTLVLQGAFARHSDPISNSTTSLDRIFDRAILGGGRYAFSDSFNMMLSALIDTESHGGFTHLEGNYTLTDAWKLGLALDAIWGVAETPLGSYNRNERAIISAKTAF